MNTMRHHPLIVTLLAAGSVMALLTACPAPMTGPVPSGASSAPGATGATGPTGVTGPDGATAAPGTTAPGATPAPGGTASPGGTPAPGGSATPAPGGAGTLIASATSPLNAATGVGVNQSASVTFNQEMDAKSLDGKTFTLTGPGNAAVKGDVSYDAAAKTATFKPAANLAANTLYTATVTTGAKGTQGNALASNLVWTFTTGTTASQNAIAMSSTLNQFAVLGGSTVTNTGPSVVTGDLGLSPGSQIVGFDGPGGPGILNGTKHVNTPAATQAKLDLTTSFNEAAARSTGPISVSGNLGGMTLAPGLYKSQTSLAVSSGDLTLDAKGDANAVWVFQMGSTLTTTPGRQVILSGGAKANNVFWQVGSSATLGTTTKFKGNILASVSITLDTGAELVGRALARNGAVSLKSATVTKPAQ